MRRIGFADSNLKELFTQLSNGSYEDRMLHKRLNKAFEDIRENPFDYVHIPKRLIPKHYIKKFGISDLWKYDLPNGWRVLYSVDMDDIEIISIILEWLDHKNYEMRFKY